MNTIIDYVNELEYQRDLLADILSEKGVTASRSEKFNTLISKVREVSGGGNEFDKSGIFGLFTADSVDISNNLWRNEISGYNNIELVGGSINGGAVHFASDEYGLFSCIEPNTVYAVFKSKYTSSTSNIMYYPVISKKISPNSRYYGFDLFSYYSIWTSCTDYNGILFSAIENDIVTAIDSANYHVACYSRTGTTVKLYIDGVLIGQQTAKLGNYGGVMLINNTSRGNQMPAGDTTPTNTDIKMCAFGLTYHDESIVQQNTAYLMQKYAINAGE